MLKDIDSFEVENIMLAMCEEIDQNDQKVMYSFIINKNKFPIHNVLIRSEGYDPLELVEKTSTLRHYYEKIDSESFAKIEIITDELLGITNEFYVSYYIKDKIYYRLFVFPQGFGIEDNKTNIPILNNMGFMIL